MHFLHCACLPHEGMHQPELAVGVNSKQPLTVDLYRPPDPFDPRSRMFGELYPRAASVGPARVAGGDQATQRFAHRGPLGLERGRQLRERGRSTEEQRGHARQIAARQRQHASRDAVEQRRLLLELHNFGADRSDKLRTDC
jgi:hypothetical protein